jgi:hypothetical protein
VQVDPQLIFPSALAILPPLTAPPRAIDRANCVPDPWLKVAVTACDEVIGTLQEPAPEHAPLHPPKTEPIAGAAVKATVVPSANMAEQVVPQLTPAGVLEMAPTPGPARLTDRVSPGTKFAVTDVSPDTVIVQVLVPTQGAPFQPANAEPASGEAVKVTVEPLLNAAEQVLPHEMPAGRLVITPVPEPAALTDMEYWGAGAELDVKLAVTL